jgi:glycosyltransferase involved in cell wall biosynthesis
MRVLYVAFYFPPTSGGGVERTLRFCEHLPEHGIDCEVVAPVDARWLADDPASLGRIPDGLRVHRVRYRGPGNRVLPADRIAVATGTVARTLVRARLAPRRLLLPDVDVPWLVDLVPEATRLLRSGRFDALLTTSPPHSVTLAGGLLTRRTGVPWVADWRDPWLANPDVARDRRSVRAKLAASARLARIVAPRMAGAACVNEAIADEVRALAPGVPVEVIPNGAEVDRIAALGRHPDPRLTFLFTGYFFGDRGPGVFLDALASALGERSQLRDQLRVRFIGAFPDAQRERVAALGLDGVVEIEPTRPHDAVLQAQRDADVLLLFMQDRAGAEAVVPAKTWEYLAADRPVLALVPPNGAAARELTEAGAGHVVAPHDADGVRRAILDLADRQAAGTLAVPGLSPAARERISRRGRAAQLAGLLRRAAG